MSENRKELNGIENIFTKYLDDAMNMEQDNMLIFLSLVNLMSIINIIEQRVGETRGARKEEIPEVAGKALGFDAESILSMLGGKDVAAPDPDQLRELISGLMDFNNGIAEKNKPT